MADRTFTSQSDPVQPAGVRPRTGTRRPRTTGRRARTARLDTSTSSIGELPDQTFYPEGEEDDYFEEDEEYESEEDDDVFAFARPQTAAPQSGRIDEEDSTTNDETARNTLANMTPASPTVVDFSRPTTAFATLAGQAEDAEKRPTTRGGPSRVKIISAKNASGSSQSQETNGSASTFAAMELLQRASEPPLAVLDYENPHPQSLSRPVTDSAALIAAARRSSNPNNTALLSSIRAEEARRQSAGKVGFPAIPEARDAKQDSQVEYLSRAPATAQSHLSAKPSFMSTSSLDGTTTDGGFSALTTDVDDAEGVRMRSNKQGFRMRNFNPSQRDELEAIPGSRDGSTWAAQSEFGGATTIPDGMTTKGDGLGNMYRKWDREDSENLGYMEEPEEEDSPYEEVRASVSNIDDPEMPGKHNDEILVYLNLYGTFSSYMESVGHWSHIVHLGHSFGYNLSVSQPFNAGSCAVYPVRLCSVQEVFHY